MTASKEINREIWNIWNIILCALIFSIENWLRRGRDLFHEELICLNMWSQHLCIKFSSCESVKTFCSLNFCMIIFLWLSFRRIRFLFVTLSHTHSWPIFVLNSWKIQSYVTWDLGVMDLGEPKILFCGLLYRLLLPRMKLIMGKQELQTRLIKCIAWVVLGQVIQAHDIKALTVPVVVIFWQRQGHRFIPVWASFILRKVRIPN